MGRVHGFSGRARTRRFFLLNSSRREVRVRAGVFSRRRNRIFYVPQEANILPVLCTTLKKRLCSRIVRSTASWWVAEREFPVLVWYAFKKINPPQKIALARKKIKGPIKHKNTPKKRKKHPPKAQKHPQKAKKNTQLFFALSRKKETALFQKLIVFAGTPRRPATPGIPALHGGRVGPGVGAEC